jgi:hypothetical protein
MPFVKRMNDESASHRFRAVAGLEDAALSEQLLKTGTSHSRAPPRGHSP